MIGFRYHLVSIVAVFLALGVGILLGSTVVEQELIDGLRDQIRSANADVDRAQAERAELREVRQRHEDLIEQSGPQLVQGRLVGVPVIVLAVRGVDEDPVDDLHALLASAGARHEGTVWLTERLRLREEADLDQLSDVLARPLADARAARAALAGQLAAELLQSRTVPGPAAAGDPPSVGTEPRLLSRLVTAGFADYEPQASGAVEQDQLPLAGSRFAVVSGRDAEVPNEQLLHPLLRAMTSEGVVPVVASEAMDDADAEEDEGDTPESFVTSLREDDQVSSRLSTVDNLGDVAGQAATVLALQAVAGGAVGHYGVAEGAQRLLPAPES